MIFDKEFIWYEDHYVYHIATVDNIESIIKNGLVPKCGLRSKSVEDNKKAIYFFDSLYSIDNWIDELYKNKSIKELELLRFNLKRRKWFFKDAEIGDFYLTRPINNTNIDYLRIYDNNGKPLSLNSDYIFDKDKLVWDNIKKYKSLIE